MNKFQIGDYISYKFPESSIGITGKIIDVSKIDEYYKVKVIHYNIVTQHCGQPFHKNEIVTWNHYWVEAHFEKIHELKAGLLYDE